jgi:hypothetical protein
MLDDGRTLGRSVQRAQTPPPAEELERPLGDDPGLRPAIEPRRSTGTVWRSEQSA